jgi:CDP-glycerol glycerophosphotransferase
MQELLCVSDMLITDYSSAMFDFAMLERPCLLYATDIEKYDRGYYFRFDELPFPLARTQEELLSNLASFDRSEYDNRVTTFFDTNIGIYDDGHASEAIAEWMISRSIS